MWVWMSKTIGYCVPAARSTLCDGNCQYSEALAENIALDRDVEMIFDGREVLYPCAPSQFEPRIRVGRTHPLRVRAAGRV